MSRAFSASLLLGAWSNSNPGNIDRTERQVANSKSLKLGPLWNLFGTSWNLLKLSKLRAVRAVEIGRQ
jgi:hypothetical protein